jgi:hypothetical protein
MATTLSSHARTKWTMPGGSSRRLTRRGARPTTALCIHTGRAAGTHCSCRPISHATHMPSPRLLRRNRGPRRALSPTPPAQSPTATRTVTSASGAIVCRNVHSHERLRRNRLPQRASPGIFLDDRVHRLDAPRFVRGNCLPTRATPPFPLAQSSTKTRQAPVSCGAIACRNRTWPQLLLVRGVRDRHPARFLLRNRLPALWRTPVAA